MLSLYFYSRVISHTCLVVVLPTTQLLTVTMIVFYGVFKEHIGGDERDRTADPLLARQVLSQLSYAPNMVRLFISFA